MQDVLPELTEWTIIVNFLDAFVPLFGAGFHTNLARRKTDARHIQKPSSLLSLSTSSFVDRPAGRNANNLIISYRIFFFLIFRSFFSFIHRSDDCPEDDSPYLNLLRNFWKHKLNRSKRCDVSTFSSAYRIMLSPRCGAVEQMHIDRQRLACGWSAVVPMSNMKSNFPKTKPHFGYFAHRFFLRSRLCGLMEMLLISSGHTLDLPFISPRNETLEPSFRSFYNSRLWKLISEIPFRSQSRNEWWNCREKCEPKNSKAANKKGYQTQFAQIPSKRSRALGEKLFG